MKIQKPVAKPAVHADRIAAATTRQPASSPASAKPAGWAPRTAAASGPVGVARPKYPPVATLAKGLVDANARASKADSQMAMVEGSVEINHAADAVLKRAVEELSSQLRDRGQDQKADAVLADLAAFNKKVGPAMGYRVDPERGSMASLEDNGERMTKVTAKLTQVAGQLGKVNSKPAGENQQAYNRSANGDAVRNEALFAVAFQKAADGPNGAKATSAAQKFFSTLPKNVDAQIESRGGSLEPLERAGATATALAQMTKSLSAIH